MKAHTDLPVADTEIDMESKADLPAAENDTAPENDTNQSTPHIKIPVSYVNETLLRETIDLLEQITNEAQQLEILIDNKSETTNAKWYREKFAKLFLLTTVLSGLTTFGLNIALRFMSSSDQLKTIFEDIAYYGGYGSMATTFISVYLQIPPDLVPLSLKKLCGGFANEDIERLNAFIANLDKLGWRSMFIYHDSNITKLASLSLNTITEPLKSPVSANINAAKNLFNRLPSITENLTLLFYGTSKRNASPSAKEEVNNNVNNESSGSDDEKVSLLRPALS